MNNPSPVKVLFVCLGNICRSPMAEAVFRHQVQAAGLSAEIEIDSAGTGNWHVGEEAHHGTRAILRQKDITHQGKARQICERDLGYYDYIITMDDANFEHVTEMGAGSAEVRTLLSFSPNQALTEVPDPYYYGGFDKVYELIDQACAELLAHIQKTHLQELSL